MSTFSIHKSASDDDVFSIGGVNEWLNGSAIDLSGSAVTVVDSAGSPVAGIYTAGSMAYNGATGVLTVQLHGGVLGEIYGVLIDVATQGPPARTKRYRLMMTIVD